LDYTRRVNARTSVTVANRETVIAHRFWKLVAAVGKSWIESSRSNQPEKQTKPERRRRDPELLGCAYLNMIKRGHELGGYFRKLVFGHDR
jgi:hypothetical protein